MVLRTDRLRPAVLEELLTLPVECALWLVWRAGPRTTTPLPQSSRCSLRLAPAGPAPSALGTWCVRGAALVGLAPPPRRARFYGVNPATPFVAAIATRCAATIVERQ